MNWMRMVCLIVSGMLSVGVSIGQVRAIPRDTSYTVSSTYKKIVKDYPNCQPVNAFSMKGISQKMDRVYLTLTATPYGTRQLHADVFQPKGAGIHPAILLIHGGGWRSGDRSMNTPMAQQLAARGFVVISVEYRLSLEARYPAAIHDIKAAIRWTRANARQLKIDPERIAIGGCSAGGQLASLVGATNGIALFEGSIGNKKVSSNVQAVVDMDGLLDFTDSESLALTRTDYSADVFWLEGNFEKIPERWKEASALTWAGKKCPPFLFINSSQTRFHAGCKNMYDTLRKSGVYAEVHKFEDAPHSFWLFQPWFDPTVTYIENFLNKVFKTHE